MKTDQITARRPAATTQPRRLSAFDGPRWIALRVVCDLVALVAGCVVGLLATTAHGNAWLLGLFPPLTLMLLHSRGRYIPRQRDLVLDDLTPGFGAVSISAMAIFMAQVLIADEPGSIGPLMAWTWSVSLASVTIVGITLGLLQRTARRRRIVESPTLIVGTDASSLDIALRLRRHPEYGLRPVGFLAAGEETPPAGVPPILGRLDDLEDLAATHNVRTVIIGYPEVSLAEMLRFIARCDKLGMQTSIVPRFASVVNHQTRFEYLGTVPLLNLRAVNPESWRFAVKHGIDRVVAALALVLLAPLLAIVAIGVRLSSRGPVLFHQPRAGRDGRLFNLVKFRTMIDANRDDPLHELDRGLAPGGVEGIDRRTRFGRLLRRTSLDELPQLFNVLRGEMSLVGPRPERPEFAELFRQDIERYHERHRVRSGITGWAQVHGLRGQTPLIDRIEFDNFYIEHWSLSLDLKIILLTIPALLRGS